MNGSALMVGTYNALFNGRSKFKLRGGGTPQEVEAVILDDAHVAFSVIRDAFTLSVSREKNREIYDSLTTLFRSSFSETDRIGTFDDVVAGDDYAVLDVPYWAWNQRIQDVREILRPQSESFAFQWPLLRDKLHLCHALIGCDHFTISPIVPLVDMFPTFTDAKRRIYMSATISNDSDIIRTFDADPSSISNPIKSQSLAGVSERMVLIPDLMPFRIETRDVIAELAKWTVEQNYGVTILTQSDNAAEEWREVATFAKGSAEVESTVESLQKGEIIGPVVFANRYDGMDLPGNSCRLLILSGLPKGTSDYELYRAAALHGGTTIMRMLAQRIEQGIGRGARGSGDHCVVILHGADIAGWIAKDANFRLLTDSTRAQMEMGIEISRAVSDLSDMRETIERSYTRDTDWTEYHAETLAERLDEASAIAHDFTGVTAERKAMNLWQDGHHQKAISTLEKVLNELDSKDRSESGWLSQLAARISDNWGNRERSESLQQRAYASNRNLLRPKVCPPYQPLVTPGEQATNVVNQFEGYHLRRGFLKSFDDTVAFLHEGASATQFEKALADLGTMIGLVTERHDDHGVGPDVLWLFPDKKAWVIEAKSRKKDTNALKKGHHGQLLVASQWFAANYPGHSFQRVVMHPRSLATEAASADETFALTYAKLINLISDARALVTKLCESQLAPSELLHECSRLLSESPVSASALSDNYLKPFTVAERSFGRG
ncbi:dead/deah box helicase domain-containing protein [Rhodopirellula maiorica SM1]|uniref:Dead/deah box helicase domain-containing protein n=1 Tax=Rhodopirellula maiorica SM1 TaxID=1265738 RepID=M5RME8_9BACT|nr:dead/deah box helicase domain-containing protein [Rhodopirellula maiorica SM1]